jgi:hypothetical protein
MRLLWKGSSSAVTKASALDFAHGLPGQFAGLYKKPLPVIAHNAQLHADSVRVKALTVQHSNGAAVLTAQRCGLWCYCKTTRIDVNFATVAIVPSYDVPSKT